MTSQRLYSILKLIDSLDRELSLQSTLDQIKETLGNLVSSPAQPTYQATLAAAIASFTEAVKKMAESITPSQAEAVHEIGGAEFFDPSMAGKITDSIQSNAMTPSVPRDLVQDFATRRATFLTTVRSARQALEKLQITDSGTVVGPADVAFLIPREIFENQLGLFAKELNFISRLVQDFTEARTGKAEPVVLQELSSSVPTIALVAALPALNMLGTVINKFLDAWKKIEEIRQMHSKLSNMGLSSKVALQELTEEITTTITEVVEESTTLVMADYAGNRGDLPNAIRSDIRRLYGQIERGLTVEFRVQPQGANEEQKKALEQLSQVAKELKFPQITAGPLLLGSGEVLEDVENGGNGGIPIVRHTRRTTKTTTTTKKEPPKEKDGKEQS